MCTSVASGEMVDSTGKRIDAFMVDEPPVLDGVLDDDAWAFGAVITDLHQVIPAEFEPPSEDSLIYVVYTKDALYVGARFYDREPDKIGALVLRQGDWSWGEDTITVMIDPLNQGRNGYAFDLSANGLRNQALYENVTRQNWSWQGIWHGEARLDEEGWIAELEIPFKTLSFDPENDVWGLNIGRYIGRKTEQIAWTSQNRDLNPATFGEMTGLSGADKGVGLDIVPSARISESKDFESNVSSDLAEPAIDAESLSRFLLSAETSGAEVIPLLSKADLVSAKQHQQWLDRLKGWGYQALAISRQDPIGLDVLADRLSRGVAVLCGPSGVGKSSLLNALVPELQLRTAAVSGKLQRGRHTTRHVELHDLPSGGLLADTPGFNRPELPADPELVAQLFPEIRQQLEDGVRCRFRNCRHLHEPGCGLDRQWERYPSYVELMG